MKRPQVHTERRVAILPNVTMPAWLLRYGRLSRTAGKPAFIARMRAR